MTCVPPASASRRSGIIAALRPCAPEPLRPCARISVSRPSIPNTVTREALMTTVLKHSLFASSLVLALTANLADAQTAAAAKPAAKPAAKTLGGKAAGSGKLMTRDELRACLARLDDLNQSAKDIEAQRPQLDRERDELKASGEALKADRAEVDRTLVEVRDWEAKVRALGTDIESFNKRSAELKDAPRNQQEKLAEDLKADRERLQRSREGLTVQEAAVVPVYQNAVTTYNERATARDAKVTDWNQRNAAAADASAKQQEARALWLNECANRPYREDDEKAIKAGK
jgi:septal ring factor EnvC (AmiA/AmiB activator)